MANPAVTYTQDGTWLWHGQTFAEHVAAARDEIELELQRDRGEFWKRTTLAPNQCFWADGRFLSPHWKQYWAEQAGEQKKQVENHGSQMELEAPLSLVLDLVGG